MAFTYATPFPFEITPMANIGPLTYRDGATYLRVLENMKSWLNTGLVPEFNEGIGNAITEFQQGIANAEATITEAKGGWQEQWAQFIIDVDAYMLGLTDDSATALLNDPDSAFHAAVDALMIATVTPAAQQVAADYVGSQPAVVAAAAAAVNANPNIAALQAAVPWKTVLADGTDLDTLFTPGVYTIATSTAAATMLNLPAPYSGTIIISKAGTGNVLTMEFIGSGTNGFPEKHTRITRSTTVWQTPWAADRVMQGFLPAGTDLNTHRVPGEFVITPDIAATLVGLPAGIGTTWTGMYQSVATANNVTATRTQRLRILTGAVLKVFERLVLTSTTTPGTWVDMTPALAGPDEAADAGPYRHTDLLTRARMRRGPIGTGKAAVAFRFDHHLVPFRDSILPLLKKYNLPWAQIINPSRVNTYSTDLLPWAELQAMALDGGGEIWNHGGDHADAGTETALYTQIVTAKETIAANCPELAIEGWAPPGLTAGAYLGASPFDTVEANTGTYAGQLILGHHAFVAGYADGLYRALDGHPPVGAPHLTMDAATPASVAGYLNTAIERDAGLALMLHPNLVGTAGYITLADVETVFADVAARRDAGTLDVVTYSGLFLAENWHTRRHDLAPKANQVVNVAVGAGAPHTVTVSTNQRKHQLGATKEVRFQFTAAAAGTLTIAVTGKPSTTHPIVSGVNVIRRPVTIGLNSGNVSATATPTVGITVTGVHVYGI